MQPSRRRRAATPPRPSRSHAVRLWLRGPADRWRSSNDELITKDVCPTSCSDSQAPMRSRRSRFVWKPRRAAHPSHSERQRKARSARRDHQPVSRRPRRRRPGQRPGARAVWDPIDRRRRWRPESGRRLHAQSFPPGYRLGARRRDRAGSRRGHPPRDTLAVLVAVAVIAAGCYLLLTRMTAAAQR